MARLKDLTGQQFGRIVILRRDPSPAETTGAYWICSCDCGNEFSARGSNLTKGDIRSCGCLRRELAAARMTRHGGKKRSGATPEYRVWSQMIGRCHTETNESFPDYGARGIIVCERWRSDFAAFLSDMGPRPSLKHTLDRIENDGNYEPGNCRWATRTQQNRNRRVNVTLLLDGALMTLAEAAERCGLAYSAVQARLRDQGLLLHRALGLRAERSAEWVRAPKPYTPRKPNWRAPA